MKKKISIYHFLVALMLSTLLLPAFAGATPGDGGSNSDAQTGSLTIHKFEQDPEKGQSPGEAGDGSELSDLPAGEALEDVEFTLTQTHSYDPSTDKWTTVEGVPFTRVTDQNGQIVVDNIELGRYTVQETDGPDHVNLNTDIFQIDIPMTNAEGTELNYNVHIYPKNETIRGAVELHKVDGATCKEADPGPQPQSTSLGNNEDCEGLEGVTFDLYKGEQLIQEGLITNDEGKIKVNGLAYGSYTFKEVNTVDGYVLGGERTFFISESGIVNEDGTREGTVVQVVAKNYSEPGIEKTVDETYVNRGEKVSYTITVDLPADIKEYTNFVVTDELHENLEYVSHETLAGFDFSQNGQTLTWTGTPTDLNSGKVEITFTAKVKEDAEANVGIDNIATIDYTNKHDSTGEKHSEPITVTPTVGGLKVLKQDGDSKAKLEGAEFELRHQDGTVYKSGTTNSEGVIDFGEVDYGTYDLVETKAPNGYSKLNKSKKITINKETDDQTIVVDNYKKSGWELPKTGGIGTMLFTFVGLSLMGGASAMFLRRRNGESA